MLLSLVHFAVWRLLQALVPSSDDDAARDVELLVLRHQLKVLQVALTQVGMRRMGRPEDVAALALHLCSDEAAYTTGQIVSPNGGIRM